MRDIIAESQLKFNNKYSNYEIDGRQIRYVCPEHGQMSANKYRHVSSSHGCAECARIATRQKLSTGTDNFIAQSVEKFGTKFTYTNTTYINCDTNVTLICDIHGQFEMTPYQHLRSPSGCPVCSNAHKGINKRTLTDIAEQAATVHNNTYQYIDIDSSGQFDRIKVVCPEHGEFWQDVGNHLRGHIGCKSCKGSKFEVSVKEFINSVSSVKHAHSRTYNFELDIVVNDRIAIECNGSYWHTEANGKDKKYHNNKTKVCADNGIQLIHIWEHDWNTKQELIKSRIKAKLSINERIYARKTDVRLVNNTVANAFLNENHIQGSCPASVRYGLYHNDELVALMTFGKSRYKKDIDWELIRYCSKQDINVVGGASKLLKQFMLTHDGDIISYSDRMWNNGGLYKAIGFEYSHTSDPAYYYTQNYINFENRVKYQKHKLPKLLETFDPDKTEWENMQANGYDRIWDCGNDVWILRR